MYIEFRYSPVTEWVTAAINHEMHAWSDRYSIPYFTKTVKYGKRFTFDDDTHYSFFAMTWNPSLPVPNYYLIEPMKIDRK
jgi:hypothetical protein